MTGATLAYDARVIAQDLSVSVRPGSFTVILGPNACGKSTTLRALANLLRPRSGQVTLDGQDIHAMGARALARRLGLLPQSASAPEGITVADLVARGRYPHQSMLSRWTAADADAVARALEATGMQDLSDRPVDELSGGQRQRAWVALVLAQETGLLLLDEPTTFLDVSHQIGLLDLFAQLNDDGQTVVAVLHDINHAARYASDLIIMKDGAVHSEGTPEEIIVPAMLQDVFGIEAQVIEDPVNGGPLVVPRHGHARR
ncbi:ABC transporter ATP-binding protein [Brachybacterium sp. AOP25-B2-12]|uniref:ABC transporter ATP-binding protein n=1 Tax=Brachybacterium sp. AOP25-B2-12 TaxID=3457710 RepID=UPI004033F691